MSDMLDMIIESSNRIFKDNCTKQLLDDAEDGNFAIDLWNIIAESGLSSIALPENKGGAGGDFIDAFNILKLAGKYGLPLPLAETLIAKWLGTELGFTFSNEPVTFSIQKDDNISFKMTGDGYSIAGEAKNVPWASAAKHILLLGKSNEKDVIAFVPLDNAKIIKGKNLAAEPRDHVIFPNVLANGLSLQEVNCVDISEKSIHLLALAKSAMIAGAAEKVLALSLFYANERQQFGRSLHRFQSIQQHIAVLTGETTACLTAANSAIYALQGGQYEKEIPLAKMKLSESAGVIAMAAHQLHGAIGMTYEHMLHHLTRRLWSWRDEAGNEAYWGKKLTKLIMKDKDSSLWEILTNDKQFTKVKE